jgi:hypothetical protein
MTYNAERTGQITEQGQTRSSLKTHELDGSGEILCGQPVRPWHGKTMVVTAQGPGVVTCLRCSTRSSASAMA